MYQINQKPEEELISVAVELRSRAVIECDNTAYLYPVLNKLVVIKLLRSHFSIDKIWFALNKLGFHKTQFHIFTYWVSESEVLGEFIASHELLHYSIYKKDKYYLFNEKEFEVMGSSEYVDDLPSLISPDETINNFIG